METSLSSIPPAGDLVLALPFTKRQMTVVARRPDRSGERWATIPSLFDTGTLHPTQNPMRLIVGEEITLGSASFSTVASSDHAEGDVRFVVVPEG